MSGAHRRCAPRVSTAGIEGASDQMWFWAAVAARPKPRPSVRPQASHSTALPNAAAGSLRVARQFGCLLCDRIGDDPARSPVHKSGPVKDIAPIGPNRPGDMHAKPGAKRTFDGRVVHKIVADRF
jgi:hypothetical protein